MKPIIVLLLGLGICLWTGCSTMPVAPAGWLGSESEKALATPLGRFANAGGISKPKGDAPTLSALLFDRKLEGFEIDNIGFESTESVDKLRIQPYVGSTQVVEWRYLEAEEKEKETRVWTAKTKVDYLDGYSVASSVFLTAGAIMPISSWKRYRFYIGDDGALLIHLKSKDIVDFFYFFPIPLRNEVWLRYPKFELPKIDPESVDEANDSNPESP